MPCLSSSLARFLGAPWRAAGAGLSLAATLAVGLASPAANGQASGAPMPEVELNIGVRLIHAELANTDANRMLGLMYRKELAPNHGMLFVFDQPAQHCMWMRNTYIALAVAFLDASGTVINVEEMKAQTDDSHCAMRPARFALEMGAQWFSEHGVRPGTRIEGVVQSAHRP